ncbi:MAG: Ig-like domain-containing protein [Clostridia bacterium]|nr:Ig-like domain-containing protein [Clostridia bacterium]
MKRKLIIAVLSIFLFNILPLNAAFGEVVLTVERDVHYLLSEGIVFSYNALESLSFNERVQLSENQTPIKNGGKTYLPFRFVMENLKTIVRYEEKTGKIFAEHGIQNIELQSGSDVFYVDSQDITVRDGLLLRDGITFISSEALKAVFGLLTDEKDGYVYVGYEQANDELFEEIARLYAIKRAETLVYYVSADGDDENPGSIDAPFKTIDKAKLTIQDYLKNNEQDRDIIVYLRGGEYRLEEQILFTQNDSAENLFNIRYTSYNNENVRIIGSKEVGGWSFYRGNIYRAYVGPDLRIDMLYENGAMMTKARYPNYNYENSVESHILNLGFITQTQNRVRFNTGDFPTIYDCTDLEVNIWGRTGQMWFNHSIDVAEVDYKNNLLCLSENVFENTGKNGLYFLQGTIELLDTEGEFCYNSKDGYIYLIPGGYTMEGKSFSVPTVENVIKFGGAADRKTVKNITIENIELMNTHRSDDVHEGIHGRGNGSGVMLSYAENITVKNCDIHDVGDDGVFILEYVKNCRIQNNNIRNLGGGGISGISYTRRNVVTENNFKTMKELGYVYYMGEQRFCRVKYNLLENNFINRCGIITGHGSGIDIIHNDSGWNYVQYNKIYNVRRMGINWGFSADRDYVRYNDISFVMNGTEDGGLFYTLFEPGEHGVAFTNNYLHDSVARYSGIFGIYHDENSNGIYTANNLVERLTEIEGPVLGHNPMVGGMQFVKSVGGQVLNNIYANSPKAVNGGIYMHNSHNKPDNEDIVIKNNVVYNCNDTAVYILNFTDVTLDKFDYNTYYSPAGEMRYKGAAAAHSDWEGIMDGKFEQNSIFADPCFVDPDNSDYRYRYDSPVFTQGTKDIDVKEAGLKPGGDFEDSEGLYYIYPFEKGRVGYNSTINIASGQQAAIEVIAKTKMGIQLDPSQVTVSYENENPDVISVDAQGNVIGLKKGKAVVRVTVRQDGKAVSKIMNVLVDDTITDISTVVHRTTFSKDEEINMGMYINTEFGQLNPQNAQSITFTSEDNSIVKINDKGLLKAVGIGTAAITATASLNGNTFVKKIPVTVNLTSLAKLNLAIDKKSIKPGEEYVMPYTAFDTTGTEISLAGAAITAESDNPEIAKVISTADGVKIQGVGFGACYIKLNVVYNGVEAHTQCRVVVNDEQDTLADGWKAISWSSNGHVFMKDGTIKLLSDGYDVYGAADAATFAYQTMRDENYTIEVEMEGLSDLNNMNTAAGLMIRTGTNDAADNVHLRIRGDNTLLMTYRNEENKSSNVFISDIMTYPATLKLEKKGRRITGYYKDGGEWKTVGEIELARTDETYAGLCIFSQTDFYADAVFRDFKVNK